MSAGQLTVQAKEIIMGKKILIRKTTTETEELVDDDSLDEFDDDDDEADEDADLDAETPVLKAPTVRGVRGTRR
jgi:hypothetical protein